MQGAVHNNKNDRFFTAKCPYDHIHKYDKREVCPNNSTIYLGKGDNQLSEIILTCKEPGCLEEFYVEIDCEGYV